MSPARDPRLVVVALGGRALETGGRPARGREAWLRALERSLPPLLDVVAAGFRVVLVPGAGPTEDPPHRAGRTRASAPVRPLDVHAAERQGAAGYGVLQALTNLCRARAIEIPMAVVVTRVEVSADDPAFARPTRAVGPPRSVAEARRLTREHGWTFTGRAARRRLVAVPRPCRILEAAAIRRFADTGALTIAAAGGGVPVVDTGAGHRGADAVLETDATAGLLGTALGADRLVFLTGVERVEVGHRTVRAIGVEHLSVQEGRALLAAREFPAASIGQKIEAAVEFVAAGGREAIVTSLPSFRAALDGRAGTRVVP